ncbi:MAG: PIN domain-containing protein [Promethearchaeia archaeon]
MKNAACLDTGIVTQFYSKNPPKKIVNVINRIKKKELKASLLYPILVEIYFHICKLLGKDAAETRVASFLNNYSVKVINLNYSLIFKAGGLKCRYAHILSYNDCLLIAYALNKKITLYTTEKDLKKTVPSLKVKEYTF